MPRNVIWQQTAVSRNLRWRALGQCGATVWEPLGEFLGVEVPGAPLPRVNDSASFIERVVDMSMDTLVQWRGSQATDVATERPPAATPMG